MSYIKSILIGIILIAIFLIFDVIIILCLWTMDYLYAMCYNNHTARALFSNWIALPVLAGIYIAVGLSLLKFMVELYSTTLGKATYRKTIAVTCLIVIGLIAIVNLYSAWLAPEHGIVAHMGMIIKLLYTGTLALSIYGIKEESYI